MTQVQTRPPPSRSQQDIRADLWHAVCKTSRGFDDDLWKACEWNDGLVVWASTGWWRGLRGRCRAVLCFDASRPARATGAIGIICWNPCGLGACPMQSQRKLVWAVCATGFCWSV